MLKIMVKYITSISSLSLLGILLLDYIILPNYVGYDNEHYLPDVRGHYLEKASYQLRALGFSIELAVVPYSAKHIAGTVIKMFPRAFTKVKEGHTINLTVAGQDQEIDIPDLSSLSLRNTKIILTNLGLGIDTIIYEYDNKIPIDYVTFQHPRKGQVVKSSTNMTIGISRGTPPDYYIIPDIVNLSLNRAQEEILNNGLRVGQITREYQPELLPNTVIEQNMTAGMRVSFPASINLTVTSTTKE